MRAHAASRHSIVLAFDTLLFWDYCNVRAGPRMHCGLPGIPTPKLLQGWSTNEPVLAVERGQSKALMRCESEETRLLQAQ